MNFNEILVKAVELNKAIDKLEKETKVLDAIVKEKREAKEKEILRDLQKYVDAMEKLGIHCLETTVATTVHYFELNRLVAIKIVTKHPDAQGGNLIYLGVASGIMQNFSFYDAFRLDGQDVRNKELKSIFLENWGRIKPHLDEAFSKAFEKILEEKKQKAMSKRESAVSALVALEK